MSIATKSEEVRYQPIHFSLGKPKPSWRKVGDKWVADHSSQKIPVLANGEDYIVNLGKCMIGLKTAQYTLIKLFEDDSITELKFAQDIISRYLLGYEARGILVPFHSRKLDGWAIKIFHNNDTDKLLKGIEWMMSNVRIHFSHIYQKSKDSGSFQFKLMDVQKEVLVDSDFEDDAEIGHKWSEKD